MNYSINLRETHLLNMSSTVSIRSRVDMTGMPEKFFSTHFKRWQQRMNIWLTMLGLLSFIESDCPEPDASDSKSVEKIIEWKERDQLTRCCILSALSNVLFDV